jgi:hypothetical protein
MATRKNRNEPVIDGAEEVSLEQAIAEQGESIAEEAEAKVKPVKIRPLSPDAKYVVTAKGREYAGKADKVTNQRPIAEAAGTGKDWYGIAAKRPARRQQVMRVLADLAAPWTAEEGRKAIADAIAAGTIGKGSENATVLLGLCHACAYFEAE